MHARHAEGRYRRGKAALAVLRDVAKPSQERIFAAASMKGFPRAKHWVWGCKGAHTGILAPALEAQTLHDKHLMILR